MTCESESLLVALCLLGGMVFLWFFWPTGPRVTSDDDPFSMKEEDIDTQFQNDPPCDTRSAHEPGDGKCKPCDRSVDKASWGSE